jgi:hypothetical protein
MQDELQQRKNHILVENEVSFFYGIFLNSDVFIFPSFEMN